MSQIPVAVLGATGSVGQQIYSRCSIIIRGSKWLHWPPRIVRLDNPMRRLVAGY